MADRGFTLIEILVVVAIIGIAGSVIAISGQSGPRRTVEAEADRLLQILTVARDEAEISGQTLALIFSSRGYGFERRNRAGRWSPINDDLLRPHLWPFPVSAVKLEPESLGQQLRFEPDGRSQPFLLRIEALEQRLVIDGDALGRFRLRVAQ